MSDHYRRDQIMREVDWIDRQADRDELRLSLKVRDSKHLSITADEARAIAALLDRNDNPPAAGDVVATPLNGIQSGEHYRRCAEMAAAMSGYCLACGRLGRGFDQTDIASLFAYLAGSTNERPW